MTRFAIAFLSCLLPAILCASALPQTAGTHTPHEGLSDPVAKLDQQPWVSPTSTLAATTVVSSLLVWLVTKHMPAVDRRHAKDLGEARDAFSATLDRICDREAERDKRHYEALNQVSDALAALRVHCATNATKA